MCFTIRYKWQDIHLRNIHVRTWEIHQLQGIHVVNKLWV